jgi:hypothetical protein
VCGEKVDAAVSRVVVGVDVDEIVVFVVISAAAKVVPSELLPEAEASPQGSSNIEKQPAVAFFFVSSLLPFSFITFFTVIVVGCGVRPLSVA